MSVEDLSLAQFRDGSEGFTDAIPLSHGEFATADGLGFMRRLKLTSSASEEVRLGDLAVSALPAHGSHLAVGTSEGTVSIRKMDDLENEAESNIVRQTLAITQLKYSSDGKLLYVSSKEPDILVYSSAKKSVIFKIPTFGVGVKALALSPSDRYLAYVDENASLKILHLQISDDGSAISGQEKVLTLGDIAVKNFCRNSKFGLGLGWHPTQPMLAIPSAGGTVSVASALDAPASAADMSDLSSRYLSRSSTANAITQWHERMLISVDGSVTHFSNDLTVSRFSSCGKFLASGDSAGSALLWKVNISNIGESEGVKRFACSNTGSSGIVDLQFGSATDRFLLLCSQDGFAFAANAIPEATAAAAAAESSKSGNFKRLQKTKDAKDGNDSDNDFLEKEEAAPAPVASSSAAASSKAAKIVVKGRFDSEAAEVDGSDDEVDNADDVEIDGFPPGREGSELDLEDNMYSAKGDSTLKEAMRMLAQAKGRSLQEPFQPSSSKFDEKGRRYLVWNSVGSIVIADDNMSYRYDVRFTDASSGKAEQFESMEMYSRAAMSKEGAVFATDPIELTEEEKFGLEDYEIKRKTKGSTIYYRAFPNQRHLEGCNSSFTYTMAEGEAALAVAVGCGWVAVATSRNLLRIFSSSGLQISVTFLKGQVISIVGAKSRLAVVYYNGFVANNVSSAAVDVFDFNWKWNAMKCIVSNVTVPISLDNILEWISFDVEYLHFVAIDKEGMLSMLMNIGTWQFVPILDISRIKKSIDYNYWPIMVKGGKFFYIPLHGESRPAIYPEPTKASHVFEFSLIDESEGFGKDGQRDKGHYSNALMRSFYWDSLVLQDMDVMKSQDSFPLDMNIEAIEEQINAQCIAFDKTICHAIDHACMTKANERALDLVNKLKTIKGFDIAIAIANKRGLPKIAMEADKLKQAMEASMQEDIPMDNYYEEESQYDNYEEDHREPPKARAVGRPIDFESSQSSASPAPVSKFSPAPTGTSPATSTSTLGKRAVNPFAVSSVTSPVKKRSVLEGLQDMKGSPSPVKKPLLVSNL